LVALRGNDGDGLAGHDLDPRPGRDARRGTAGRASRPADPLSGQPAARERGMTVYQGFFDLKPGTADLEFAEAARSYLDHLKQQSLLKDWRLLRRKLGLGPKELGEFQLIMEFDDLAQLD